MHCTFGQHYGHYDPAVRTKNLPDGVLSGTKHESVFPQSTIKRNETGSQPEDPNEVMVLATRH